ncbi:hypothetical protein [Mesorhizobium sp.]|uniref:hypothetical protein n=1 Tax=Mesorhizobium sp. TaxID=1871066 RepID=UPI0025BEA367|nr:hypothetical protein [Mesorhizobium sp.]
MNRHELIGCVAAAYLRDELGDDSSGVARFLIDGLSIPQTAAVAGAVLANPALDRRVSVKLPESLFADMGLPPEALTRSPATWFRDAECDKAAFLVTNVGEGGEDQSLQDMSRLGGAELLERLAAWVDAVDDGLGLDAEGRVIFERALGGLAQLRSTSLDRFAGYVLRIRHAMEVDGHLLSRRSERHSPPYTCRTTERRSEASRTKPFAMSRLGSASSTALCDAVEGCYSKRRRRRSF